MVKGGPEPEQCGPRSCPECDQVPLEASLDGCQAARLTHRVPIGTVMMDETSERRTADSLLLLLSRILLAVVFLPSGFSKLAGFTGFASTLASHGLPFPAAWAAAAVAAEAGGSLLVLVGLGTRYAALVLALFAVAAAVIGHPFWAATAAEHQQQLINFMKNVAIVGGFLALAVAGPGAISLDARLRR